MPDLTVAVTHKLTTGKTLTLDIEEGYYVMKGGYLGSHSISADADITSPARLAAHWDGYVQMNKAEDAKHAPAPRPLSRQEKKMAEALEKAQTLPESMALRGPGGLLLSLNASEVFPEDPGNGVPAYLTLPFGRASSTYDCAADVGYLHGTRRNNFADVDLSESQQEWLEKVRPVVEIFVDGWFDRIKANPAARPARKK